MDSSVQMGTKVYILPIVRKMLRKCMWKDTEKYSII